MVFVRHIFYTDFSRLRPRKNKQGAETMQKTSTTTELQKSEDDEGPPTDKTLLGNSTVMNSLQTLACQIPFTTSSTFQNEKVRFIHHRNSFNVKC